MNVLQKFQLNLQNKLQAREHRRKSVGMEARGIREWGKVKMCWAGLNDSHPAWILEGVNTPCAPLEMERRARRCLRGFWPWDSPVMAWVCRGRTTWSGTRGLRKELKPIPLSDVIYCCITSLYCGRIFFSRIDCVILCCENWGVKAGLCAESCHWPKSEKAKSCKMPTAMRCDESQIPQWLFNPCSVQPPVSVQNNTAPRCCFGN